MSVHLNFAWMMASKVFVITVGIVFAAIVNRSVGPEGRGILAEIQTWVEFSVAILFLSIDTGIYHIANKKEYPEKSSEKFSTIIYICLATTFLGGIIIFTFFRLRPDYLSDETRNLLWIIILTFGATLMARAINVFAQAENNMKISAMVGIGSSAMLAISLTAIYFYDAITIQIAACLLLLFQAFTVICFLPYVVKSGLLKLTFSTSIAKSLLKAGAKQHIATISTFLYLKVNQLMVINYCGKEEAGLFASAHSISMMVMFIPQTFQTVLFPRVIHSKDDFEVTVRSLRIGFYIWGAAVLLLMIFAKPILLLYGGEKFMPASGMFQVLMISAWVLPLSALTAPFYIKKGAFSIASATAVILGIISMSLNFYLIPKYAGMGAAVATTTTCLIGFSMALWMLWYLSKRSVFPLFKPEFAREISSIKTLLKRDKQ